MAPGEQHLSSHQFAALQKIRPRIASLLSDVLWHSGADDDGWLDGWLAGQAGGRLDPGLSHPLASAFQRSLHSGRHPIRFAFSVNPADSRRRHPPANLRGPVTIECPLPMDILCGLLSNSFEHLPSCWVCGLKPTNTQSWRRQNGDMLLILLVFHSET